MLTLKNGQNYFMQNVGLIAFSHPADTDLGKKV